MKYAYARVSSDTQNLDRQIIELVNYVDIKNIFIDKTRGKDFNRSNYQKLRKILKPGDELYIKSIDRLGRNYELINEEFRYLSKSIGVIIYVLDMPFINTFNETINNNTLRSFILDIVLQTLSFVAENERINIKERQKEGIAIAKKNGKHLGRPKLNIPSNFTYITNLVENKNMTIKEALTALNMTKTSFYKYRKFIKNE